MPDECMPWVVKPPPPARTEPGPGVTGLEVGQAVAVYAASFWELRTATPRTYRCCAPTSQNVKSAVCAGLGAGTRPYATVRS